MTSFSSRFGYAKPSFDLREDEMPEPLRNGLWDAVSLTYFQDIAEYDIIGRQVRLTTQFEELTEIIWFHFFRKPTDTRDREAKAIISFIRKFFFGSNFFSVYDFIEFLAQSEIDHFRFKGGGEDFARFCNRVLERERAAFRFAGTTLVKITDENQLESVEQAMGDDSPAAVREHIKRAAELYSQRPSPDYRNSIKESISAVEAAVAFVTDSKKVGGISTPLRKAVDKVVVHPALRDGFEKLYAYTSDADGIRHALLNDNTLTQADARYMLVSCSAFANYLMALKSN
ncbi:MAG: hypothetical protein K9G71_04845 [Rhodobacteraceae bacterium]|nr:hypothetical protein [Paracoccaceae bacterium]MCF8513663.1 hypothetical protein [Paracoccaceae bacterium]MCF8517908.1 hypothetical protein [Paracoccaceae bacterium]